MRRPLAVFVASAFAFGCMAADATPEPVPVAKVVEVGVKPTFGLIPVDDTMLPQVLLPDWGAIIAHVERTRPRRPRAPAPPPPPVVTVGHEEVVAIITAAAAEYGVDLDLMLRIADCESGFNPSAYNRSSGASGLGQHLARYWPGRADAVGMSGASAFDPVANARVTAWMLSTQGTRPWNASRGCWS